MFGLQAVKGSSYHRSFKIFNIITAWRMFLLDQKGAEKRLLFFTLSVQIHGRHAVLHGFAHR